MARIEFDNVNVSYPVVYDRGLTLKEFVTQFLFRGRTRRISSIHALKDMTLNLRDGQRVGVIGRNGAGKSTLLRTIAGVYPVDSGRLNVQGRLSTLFDITLGFEREASGWENIEFRAYLQGETPKTLRARMRDIAEFSDLGDFLDLPLKCYSTGMVMRLAFAVATSTQPEILLIDEFFGTGDQAFRAKAQQRLTRMMDEAKIIVMVGHDLAAIGQFCETVVWLEHGSVRMIGPQAEVIAAYEEGVPVYQSVDLVARYQGPGDSNFYIGRLLIEDDQPFCRIAKCVKGRWQRLTSMPVKKTAGRLRFDVVGHDLRLYLDDELVGECRDSDLTKGSVGLGFYMRGARLWDFSAQEPGGPLVNPGGWLPPVTKWTCQAGEFQREPDGWSAVYPGVSLQTADGVCLADVSVVCDVDLKAADLARKAAA